MITQTKNIFGIPVNKSDTIRLRHKRSTNKSLYSALVLVMFSLFVLSVKGKSFVFATYVMCYVLDLFVDIVEVASSILAVPTKP